jgi:hypothetical protein
MTTKLLDFSCVVVYDRGTPKALLTMDIAKALRELYNEKKRLDATIAALEAGIKATRTGSAGKSAKGRRGRKSMSAAERLEVSKRMTLYWQSRRAQLDSPSAPPAGEGQQASSTSAS